MIDTKKDPLPDYEKHSGEADKIKKYFKMESAEEYPKMKLAGVKNLR